MATNLITMNEICEINPTEMPDDILIAFFFSCFHVLVGASFLLLGARFFP